MCESLSVLNRVTASEQEPLNPAIQKIVDFLTTNPHRIYSAMIYFGINQPPPGRPALKSEQMFKK